MNNKKQCLQLAAAGVLAIIGVSGCSSSHDLSQATGSTEYLNAKLDTQPFVVPTGLQAPQFNTRYYIPAAAAGTSKEPVGKSVNIEPPVQLLPVVSGSRVGQSQSGALVWYSSTQSISELSDTLWSLMQQTLKVTDSSSGKQDYSLATPWIKSYTVQHNQVRSKFKVALKSQPDLHRVGVELTTVAAEVFQKGSWQGISVNDYAALQQRNTLMNQLAFNYQNRLNQQLLKAASGSIKVQAGKDSSELNAWIADAPYEVVWNRLEHLLPALGFTVTQAQQSLGEFKLEYKGSSLFSSDKGKPLSALDSGKYRLLLGDLGQKTSMTLFSKESTPLKAETFDKLTPTVVSAFAKQNSIKHQ
ncbi:outer membrane protein assembly factor BamC [Dongshaea marina]|uniref:outer membrane protein assembly factor BamC n=1 Tax=Dongshaea marina TaxID=2047966 RepID=UPI000D3E2A2A|nr:outer membrane protein assembly factor BamC [Dongshaea marina]